MDGESQKIGRLMESEKVENIKKMLRLKYESDERREYASQAFYQFEMYEL